MSVKVLTPTGPGLEDYLHSKIEELEFSARDKSLNLKRLEAQRNKLNTEGAGIALVRSHGFSIARWSSLLTSAC
jgi:hypothetical protein